MTELKTALFWDLVVTGLVIVYWGSLRNFQASRLPLFLHKRFFLLFFCGGLFGGRLFHILFESPSYYWRYPLHSLAVWNGGFVYYGGFLSIALLFYAYSRINFLPLQEIADTFAGPGIAASALGRIGCFIAHCCYGEKGHSPQLYDFLLLTLLAIYLQNRFSRGENALSALLLGVSVIRFFTEFFRADLERGFLFNGLLSQGQFWSLLILIATLLHRNFVYRKQLGILGMMKTCTRRQKNC